jgi:SNF2 family DNA or RNA helicase
MLQTAAAPDAMGSSAPRTKYLHDVPVTFDPADEALLVLLEEGEHSSWEDYQLHKAAEKLSLCPGFDQLLSLPLTRDVVPYAHQLATVKTVLQRLRGRALLCDEVGLGKTIEACLTLMELTLRGLARKVLILTPPSLVDQWREELFRKFNLPFVTHADPDFKRAGEEAWGRFNLVVASLTTAKRLPHAARIHAVDYDLVVLDEAHHLRNSKTVAWRFANKLKRKYILLLTATPVHNHLEELFNLITLIAPGQLHTARSFRKEHLAQGDKLTPRDPNRLKALVGEVMVRNRRATCGMIFTRRYAKTVSVSLGKEEKGLYDGVSDFVRAHYTEGRPFNRMVLQTLQMELGSTPRAVEGTLEKMAQTDGLDVSIRSSLRSFRDRAGGISGSAKGKALLGILQGTSEKAIVFTHFHATLKDIQIQLEQAGISVTAFHGGLTRKEKEESIKHFQGPCQVLISSEAGGEGRNLQFCNTVINYDLPWNPMKIEQRIGRVSRVGQGRDVYVFNLVAPETIEGYLLELLDAKIHMFELVIGEMDMILGGVSDDREFDHLLMELWAGSPNREEFRKRLDVLGEELLEAKRGYFRAQEVDDALFGEVGEGVVRKEPCASATS